MIAMSKRIEVHKALPSGTIVLSRPEQHNAIARDMIVSIQEAIEDFQNERLVRGIILTGTGTTFSAGSDLKEIEDAASQTDVLESWRQDAEAIQSLIETMLRCPKPIIAALNGDAIGLGGVLALAADLVVCHAECRFWFPESLRGLSNNLAATLLAFRGGVGVASYLLFTSSPISAEQASIWGLIHDMVQPDVVWARANEIVGEISRGSALAQKMTKHFINESLGENLFTQLSIASANLAAARTTEAAREGISAFIEKRHPKFP